MASRLLDSADADALWRSLPQASTREELDFRKEAANAAACAALFAAEPRVHARDRLALPNGAMEGACSLSAGVGSGSGHRPLPLERARADDGVGRRRERAEMWGDVGRCGEMWFDGESEPRLSEIE